MKKNLVSVILSYYKKKEHIEKTIKSLLKQTYKNYELICIYDDDNLDDLKFLKKTISKINKVKLIINKKNLGVAKSRNLAIKYTKGEFIAFLDADDLWKKNKLNDQINIMKKNKLDLTCTSYSIIDEYDNIKSVRKVGNEITYDQISKRCDIGLSTVIIKSKILKKYKFPLLKTQEDLGLWLNLLRDGHNFYPIRRSYSFWRKSNKSLSSNTYQKIKDAFKLFYYYENKNLIFSFYSVVILSLNKLTKLKS
jgi:teichuronic acid biosynthesis glycosyltransferase TuaG